MTRAGGGAFSGAATGWAQNIDGYGNSEIALTGLPAAFPLAIGDYIGWKWTAAGSPAGSYDRRALARVVTPAAASAGGALPIEAEPPLDTPVVPPGATPPLGKPAAQLHPLPHQSEAGDRKR